MKAQIFITGTHVIPKQLKKDKGFSTKIVESPYLLRDLMQEHAQQEKIIVAYLPFLEIRHFELYSHLQKTTPHLKVVFVVSELSSNMKMRLKADSHFMVLWKTEEANIAKNIHKYLDGKTVELREEKREPHDTRGLLSPSKLPMGHENTGFQPILGGAFENLSPLGSCMKIKAPFYNKKDFVNLTYQNKEGEYISMEGQVRWARWNEETHLQELGVQFLSR